MLRFLSFFIFFGFVGAGFAQDQSSALRQNVKHVKEIIDTMELYSQLERKRLYGAISQKGAIEFKLQSSMADPTSTVIGIATDGTIQEMEIRVYTTNSINQPIRQIRKDLVVGERDWVFEVMDNSRNYLVDIRVIKSQREVALVEVVHGFFYGHKSNPAFSTTQPKKGPPSHSAPRQDGDSLAPIDTYNRFEIFKQDLSK